MRASLSFLRITSGLHGEGLNLVVRVTELLVTFLNPGGRLRSDCICVICGAAPKEAVFHVKHRSQERAMRLARPLSPKPPFYGVGGPPFGFVKGLWWTEGTKVTGANYPRRRPLSPQFDKARRNPIWECFEKFGKSLEKIWSPAWESYKKFGFSLEKFGGASWFFNDLGRNNENQTEKQLSRLDAVGRSAPG